MMIRYPIFMLASLTLGGYLQAESRADRLQPPTGRIEMVLDSDRFNEVDDPFALALAVRSPERIVLKAVCAAPFVNHRSNSARSTLVKRIQEERWT